MKLFANRKSQIANRKSQIALSVALPVFLLLQGSLSYADDTEIFFSQTSAQIKPNIFFILDDSGSMDGCMLNNQRPAGYYCPGPDKRQRIDVLKATINTLLDNIENNKVNIGLMSLRYRGQHTGWECKPGNAGYGHGYCGGGLYRHPTWGNQPPRVSFPVKEINNSVRNEMKTAINNLGPLNNTPATMSLYDAARYLTAINGKHNAWAINPSNSQSPITHECQPTHLVMLTDGQTNMDVDVAAVQSLIGKSCAPQATSSEQCARELAEWMRNSDQSSLPGEQTISTHAIGFALNAFDATDPAQGQSIRDYLKDIADAGGGLFRTADKADDLLETFQEIINQAMQVQSVSFVNPSVPKNSFSSKSEHKDELYYPLFKPTNTVRWNGNLKRYRLDASGVVRDANGAAAYDNNGEIKSTSQSWWSANADGGDVSNGGVLDKLPVATQRRLFTYLDDLPPGSLPISLGQAHELKDTNSTITTNTLGIQGSGSAANAERKQLLDYIRSKKMGDPLHSAPAIFSYGCNGTVSNGQCNGQDKQMALMGTNEGFVHLFDTYTGEEQFAFMPAMLLKNIKMLKGNGSITSSQPHPYGMDNTVTVWVDKKDDGSVKAVYAYATMRRGGKGIYALDITQPTQPKLMWQIIGGETSDFERLGDTWSQPVKTKIKWKGEDTDVLIFGGGYDKRQDNGGSYRIAPLASGSGNDLYIINAKSGKRIWSASIDANLAAINYSVPAQVYIVERDGGGKKTDKATQIFFADTGGQIWRLFINDNATTSSNLITAGGDKGIIFKTQGSGLANERRFYHKPAIGFISGANPRLFIAVGSGYHAHPLAKGTQDRFYSIEVPFKKENTNTITITENELANVTTRSNDNEQTIIDEIKNNHQAGWYFDLPRNGEKALSAPLIDMGDIFFQAYEPGANTNPCLPASGVIHRYRVQLLSGVPAQSMNMTERSVIAESSMIMFPASTQALYLPSGRVLMENDTQDGINNRPPPSSNTLGSKTYWMDISQ